MEDQLKKVLRSPEVLLIGINGVVGGGIFLLPGQVAQLAGKAAVLAYLVAGLICILIGLCFAEASGMFKRTGGSYIYAEEAMGETVGFTVGWMSWLTFVAGWSALSNGFVSYLSSLLPGITPYRSLIIMLVIALLCLLNTFGVKNGSLAINIFSVAKLLPLFLLIIIGIAFNPANADLHLVPHTTGSFAKAVLILIFAYGGFEMASIPAGEMKNPQKTVAIAILGTLTSVTVFYMLIQYASFRIDPNIAFAKAPLATVGKMMIPGGLFIMTLGAALSILGTKSGVALSSPRILYALSLKRLLPGFLSYVHPKYKTPVFAIWLTGILVMIFSITGTFNQLILLNVAARLFEYLMVCISVIVLRYKAASISRSFTLPFGITIPLIASVLCVYLLTQENTNQIVAAILALVIGLIVFGLSKMGQNSTGIVK